MNDHTIRTFDEYKSVYAKSVEDPEEFWAEIAKNFDWHQKWDKVLEWDFSKPEIKWFLNAKLNISENCLDRHLESRADQAAIIWEPNDPNQESLTITYLELSLVNQVRTEILGASPLKSLKRDAGLSKIISQILF